MTIRPATPEDVPQVLPLVKGICDLHESWDPVRFDFKDNVVEMYRLWLTERAKDERSVFIIAERDGKIVAYIVGTIEPEIPIYWQPECGWIHDIFVDENYRNEGIARQLVTLSVEKFTQLGVEQVRLNTAAVNETARELFKACGFRVSTIEMLIETGTK
jgi:ribosomal protein S18 acetylase RimI-like enzyme